MLDLDALLALDAIDRRGSFARAAAELGRVPSALTYLVRKLETDLDVLLFDRGGHRAKLTAAGEEVLREGRHLLFAAAELQRRVRRVGNGWEAELRIAADTVIRLPALIDLIVEFDRQAAGTRIRVLSEVLSGTWEALVSGRADLALGTSTATPGGPRMVSGFQSLPMGEVPFVFAVAPGHPLADLPEPLAPETVRRHRAVAVGDTARDLPAMTLGLLGGQDVMTVPTMASKVAAQAAGLGCGHVPLGDAQPFVDRGHLVVKRLAEARAPVPLWYAWSTAARGRAMQWFQERLQDERLRAALLP